MKNLICLLLILAGFTASTNLVAQNVAVNDSGSMPDTSAILDVNSTTKGFLLPRLTTNQQNAIVLPATGLAIFNTTLNSFQVNTGTPVSPVWSSLTTSLTVNAWSIGGNSVASEENIGTISNFDFPFITNNTEKMRLSAGGNLGIGTNSPTALLHVTAGSAAAATAPLKFTSGVLMTTAEAGAVEYLTDNYYGTITTGAARKEFTLNDIPLTAGRVPFTTTLGRLTDLPAFTYVTNRLSPTYITLGAGSAAVGTAPLVFTSGPVLTTPLSGSVEFNGTHFYGTVGSTRYQLDRQITGTNSGDVTIGTANGLSLAGQVLSLDLAGVSTTGALSSADWNTFNNKASTANAISSLNALTGTSQTFATGTTGTNFNIASAGTVHTFNMPDASASARGVITTGTQTIAGEKTFNGNTNVEGTLGVTGAITATTLSGGAPTDSIVTVDVTGLLRKRQLSDLNIGSWSTTGNAGTLTNTNFIGTTDPIGFRIKGNNIQGVLVDSLGNVGVGRNPAFAPLPAREKFLVDAGVTTSINALSVKGSINNYLQLNIQNQSTLNAASSDIVATASGGTESTNFIDMGINGSGNTSNILGNANDAYIYNQGQNFFIANSSPKSLIFMTGGTDSATNERMRIDATGNMGIGIIPTAALHLKAGSAAAGSAPLKFTSGTNLGITEAGAVEYDGTHLYFTAANAGSRYQLDQQSGGTNSGDVTLGAGENYLSLAGQVITANAVNLSGTNVTGTLAAARFPALTGDITNTLGTLATTITAGVVTNAKLASMAINTIKGAVVAGPPVDLTGAQVNTILPVFTSTLNGLVPFSGGSAGMVLHGDGSWKDTSASTNQWSILGNTGVPSGTNFLGTTYSQGFKIKTNSVQGFLLDSLGNVGIGTNPTFTAGAPREKFLVDAGSTSGNPTPAGAFNVISGKGYLDGYLQLNIQNNSPGTSASSDVVASNNTATETTNFVDMGINSSTNTSTGVLGGAGTAYLYSTGNDFAIGNGASGKKLRFFTTGTSLSSESMNIDSAGRLSLLSVQSGTNTDSLLTIAGGVVKKLSPASLLTSSSNAWSLVGNATAATDFIGTTNNRSFTIKTNDTLRLLLDSLGNVAIGTSPVFDPVNRDRLLVDAGTGTSNAISAVGDINGYLQSNVQNTNNGNRASSDVVATANNGSASTVYIDMGINSNGYSNGASNLLNGPNTAYIYATGSDFYIGNGAQNKDLIFFTNTAATGTNGTERMRVTSAGLIPGGNGTYSLGLNNSKWSVVYAQNGAIQTSDRRLKTNIQNLQYGLKEVMKMQPVSYNWKEKPNSDNKIGLIAQDVKKLVPEVVAGDEAKENLGMNYAELVPVLINAIKEQQRQIDSLKKDVRLLKDKNSHELINVKFKYLQSNKIVKQPLIF